MDFDMPRIHPLVEQVDHLALARAFNAGDENQRGEFAVLLEIVLRVEQRLPQFRLFAFISGFFNAMEKAG